MKLDFRVEADDILVAIFALAKRQAGLDSFRAHDFKLQEVMHDLSGDPSLPLLQDYFVFSDAGPIPFSPSLTESMSRLQLSGLVGRANPEFVAVLIKPAAESYYDEVLKASLTEEQSKQLERAADKFSQLIRA